MPTEAWPPGPGERSRVVTALPRSGSVLVRSTGPPAVPGVAVVDVRPGPATVITGDRPVSTLRVRDDGGVRKFDTTALPAFEDAVAVRLAADGVDVVRFGDPAVLRRGLPEASVAAVRRRLEAGAARGGSTLLVWTARAPRAVDRRAYDVVLE